MRRADRLFSLLLELRRSRVVTARRLAQHLEVSERTVYRDIADLQASGIPIAGEAGVGYQLRGFDLPPLMFDREEVEAMVLGARVVEAWGDGELAGAASSAIAKIEALRMILKDGGIHPDILADSFGFADGLTMVKALADAFPPLAAVEGLTDQRMLEQHGDLVDRIESTKDLSKDDEAKLHEALKDFKKNGSY